MLIFHGKKTARIKKFTDNQQYCTSCKAFDLEIKLYQDYYHFYFIPLIPSGERIAKIRCKSCGEPIRSETKEKEYAKAGRTPFYMYSIPIIIMCMIAYFFSYEFYTANQTKKYIQYPEINDVYSIRTTANKFESFYFCKVIKVEKDSIQVLRNKYEYLYYQDNFSDEDYFMKDDTLTLSKIALKEMLDSSILKAVNRGYDESFGFNRTQ